MIINNIRLIAIYIMVMTILTGLLFADENTAKINHLANKIVDNAELSTVDTNNKVFKLLMTVNELKEQPNQLDKLVKSSVYDTISINKIAFKSLVVELQNKKKKQDNQNKLRESVEAISNIIAVIKDYSNTDSFSNFELARLLYQISIIQEQYNNPEYLLDDDGKMISVNKAVFESMVKAVDFDKVKNIESVGTILKQNNIVAGSMFDVSYYYKQFTDYINDQFNTVNYIVVLSVLVVILLLSKMFKMVDTVLKVILKIVVVAIRTVYLLLKMFILVIKYSVYMLNKILNKNKVDK